MHVFVTVGTTRFDALIHEILSNPFLESLCTRYHVTHLTIQSGSSSLPSHISLKNDLASLHPSIHIDIYAFKPSLLPDMEAADLIISHAGSGSILESLYLEKRLIVVINTELMDNHQQELADAMEAESYLIAAKPHTLLEKLDCLEKNSSRKTFRRFEKPNPELFVSLLDKLVE